MHEQPHTLDSEARRERLLFACAESGLMPAALLDASLSDPHNGGQRAALFSCGGKKYICKPRSGAADFAWADFLDDLAPLLEVPLPRAVRPVSPADAEYTIVPFIEGAQAPDEAEARLYYTRCGALLALCMVLGATDLHSENLIADGDSPLLVDVETLMAGVTPDKAAKASSLYDSLIFSHLLPNWMLQDGENVDVGALTGTGKNQLKLRGEPCPAHAYAEEICNGFRSAFDGILTHRGQVLQALERFADAPFRKLLRPTDLYSRLCSQISRLETEEEKRTSAARLRRAYLRGGDAWAQQMSRVCDSEIEAVLRGDIPYFFSFGNEHCLRDMHGVAAEDYFVYSPLEAAQLRLKALSPEDGMDQAKIIRQSLMADCPAVDEVRCSSAWDVFAMLETRAIRSCPSTWMGVTTSARGEAYFQSIGFDLYEGLLGVLGFYGALYEASANEAVLQAIRTRYESYRAWYVSKNERIRANSANVCLTAGLGGHIMLLGYLSRTLKDAAYLQDAAALLRRFDFDHAAPAEAWDVYGGTAGLLIALPLLRGCGIDDLLARIAAQLAEGIRHTPATLTGFAHGAAGLALALGAAQFAGGGDFTGDILRLLSWENAQFDAEACNWPDLRNPDVHGFMKGLCSGAPGIGLARMQLLRYTQDERIADICRRDIAHVQRFLREQTAPLRRDTLCCGNAALIEAAQVLSGGESCPVRLNDAPVLYHPLETNDFPAGLFHGWAGVGYALARRLPGSRSSLFVWEVTP